MADASSFEEEILSLRLWPHRSLTRADFRVLMLAFGLLCLAGGMRFLLLGAWPVAVFFAIDILVFYLAFRSNFRAANAYEQYRLTALELFFARVSARGARAEWRFNPHWVRIERREDEEFGLMQLALASRGSRVEIARFLGPDQKAAFAQTLSDALSAARRGPTISVDR